MKIKAYGDTFEVRVWQVLYFKLATLFGVLGSVPLRLFKSKIYEFEFDKFSEYWMEVGKRAALIDLLAQRTSGQQGPIGYSYEEIFQKVVRVLVGPRPCVVMFDLHQENIGKFLERFPGLDRTIFLEDVIVLPAKSKEAAYKLVEAFPENFVRTIAFVDGEIFATNYGI